MPNALDRQQQLLAGQSRFPPARGRDDDTSSVLSWNTVQSSAAADPETDDELPLPPADLKVSRMDPIQENAPAGERSGRGQPSQASAPATEAARNLVDHTNETPVDRKLRKQQEQARNRGRRGVRWVQLGAHNAINVELPHHIQQVGSGAGERSILILDHRDQRLQSPYQSWLVDEILTNAHAKVNILSDSKLVRSPTTGYHFNVFLLKTLDNFKLVFAGSMTSYGSVPCGKWDTATARVLSHSAFQPFRWPVMRDDSPTWVDLKVKLEGDLLMHFEFRGYRSDSDMTVQVNHISDTLISVLQATPFIPTFVVTIFQGWRVVTCSWEVGGRIYAISEGGIVVSLDYPLCHVELRLVSISSADAFGMDADRIEFRFWSAADRLDVACSSCSVPPSWLVVSRVSGPTLIQNANWCRKKFTRIESPDQALQLAQLASVHAHWTAAINAESEADTGPRISAVAVESHPENMHLISESPLFRKDKVIVSMDALALQAHDPETEQQSAVLPPITGGPAVQPASEVTNSLKAIAGPQRAADGPWVPQADQPSVSITEPGMAPVADSWMSAEGTLAPARRTLEQRRGDQMAYSAMTPAGFIQQVESMQNEGARVNVHYDSSVTVQEIGGSLDGSAGASTSAAPVSYGPQRRS